MAPAKTTRNHDDHKVDAPVKEKNGGAKMRRGASQQTREAPASAAAGPSQATTEASAPTLPWSSFDRRSLHAYLREHDLNISHSYVSPYHHSVLSRPGGVGLYSPTMARRRSARRQSKEQLAMAIRKHFNGLGIQENDVIVDFIYKIRTDKALTEPLGLDNGGSPRIGSHHT